MKNTRKIIQASFVIIMVVGLIVPAFVFGTVQVSRVQPALAELAHNDPDQLVRVMVGKIGNSGQVEAKIASLGGEVLLDLPIINALAVKLPARDALRLGQLASVNWVSMDGPADSMGKPSSKTVEVTSSSSLPTNTYLDTLGVKDVWAMGYQGQGVSVAVIDSGITADKDFQVDPTRAKPDSRILEQLSFNYNAAANGDLYGHGTHVAGIIGGSGYQSNYLYQGIAPKVNLISLRVSDDNGMAYESDVVAAMQWVYDNKDKYNIRVVNLSIQSSVSSSYHESPMNAAAEILWFNEIVVVAASGNKYGSTFNPVEAAPANDPFLITVGATDEKGTSFIVDDIVTSFTAQGITMDGFAKPEIVAPGQDIISVLADAGQWGSLYPERVVDGEYFRLSGTSMATPMVSGAVALLLQKEPNLTPDQVKYRLLYASDFIDGFPYLDVYKLLTTSTSESANANLQVSQLLTTGSDPVTMDSVNWNSVNWNAVNWNAVNWNAVNWNAVNWNAVNWNQ